MTPHVYNKVKVFPASIGWLSYANVNNKRDVKILKIKKQGEEIELNQSNIVSGKYPYLQAMYFYTMGAPKDNTKKFIDFVQSETGADLLMQMGFFPIK